MIGLFLILIISAIFIGYFWLKRQFLFWENRRVPHLKPDSLFSGNNYAVVAGKLSASENTLKNYRALAPHPFGGIYHYRKPVLLVRDPELIKSILIKDFHHFRTRAVGLVSKHDPLSFNLFFLEGEEWKPLRQKLTPTFTSGKMKMMFALVEECVEKLKQIVEKSALDQEEVNVKELMARYTTDVISSCAFGLEADSLHDSNSEFRMRGKELMAWSLQRRLRQVLLAFSPPLARFLRITRLSRDLIDFFINLVRDTIEYRKRNGIIRNDFLNLLMHIEEEESKKSTNFELNMEILAAQCFLFFIAGFETSSTALSFILYELAEHPYVQKKLQEEVDRVLEKQVDGKITYDSLQEMQYMDKVFNETVRLFSSVSYLERTCTEDYRFPRSDYVMRKGETLFISVHGLHRDPQYFPDPDAFNPENFDEEAKNSRPSCCFLPFGDGPRNCIGMRFGLMQVKSALTAIMKEYTVTVSPKMKLPVELKPYVTLTTSKDDIILHFNKRCNKE